ncbi:2-amino-4-hydroxy-6-hydroxymethyldihydropteridine diphosphokinase [Cellulomonas chengniuliangii]|uniref:Bifunctional folate synthesis protein n=1 Tax=Cellulomonas chengniuliangii TaxID=2968084 RepID=A0ABY5L1L7_9CELL|nr:2-amino-4-hydroxy-6-hydroxymethyldihydropteridine diphosphokinase [Cellulomonas chengniuliangii]MCC2307377.1 2-amino-4-hydroxy-6-hydroxymethyldihydropteridine diphosphokinase [Cellulomonas chengniuliangii]MCC2317986.1 2-amino-4-hydroxy-6-hydroxymethyldihydropteridine diphosphokinase [Cellulomonas chengniuliangii]UUI75840.1 2-amino-4-hydroxy-6-hydroxymethyldihydropteridine diphosphokinase [Cellulomonas chengniuliangii]
MSTEAGSQAAGGGAPWAGGVTLDSSGRPLDQIRLVGIAATGYHGVFEHERREGQRFVADVVVHLDTRRAAAGDDLAHTLHYGVLAEQVAAVLAGEPADLVETVAERIAATVLAFQQAVAVDVSVHKPQAPITVPFDDVVVTIHRDRTKLPAAEPYRPPVEAAAPAPAPAPPTSTAAFPLVATPSGPPAARVPAPTPAAEPLARPDWHGVLEGPAPAAGPVEPEPQDALDVAPAQPVDVVLALGANQGAAQETLRAAVSDLARVPGLELVDVSPLARTAAVGGPEQPDYLNAVVLARTTLAPRALLRATQAIEQAHGRERAERWGPRTLDIDLIVVGSTLAVTDDLELPHPRAHERAFVLQPWAQLDPDAVLPGLGGGPVAVLAATAPDREGIRWLALDWLTAPVPAPQPEPDLEPGQHGPVGEVHHGQHPAGDWRA